MTESQLAEVLVLGHYHAEKFGYKIALRESLAVGGKGFSQQIMRAKSAGVDAIPTMCNVEEAVNLVRQMKERNLSVKFLQGWSGKAPGPWSSGRPWARTAKISCATDSGPWTTPLPAPRHWGRSIFRNTASTPWA